MCNILNSIILHFPLQRQPLDFRQQVLALSIEQFAAIVPFFLGDRVFIHGWVVSVANELNTFLEI
jgi:hypothetical protein